MKLAIFLAAATVLVVTVDGSKSKKPINCVKSGCSGTLCVKEGEEVVSTCEWKDEYQCYQEATCKEKSKGKCGWVLDSKLRKCLKRKSSDVTTQNGDKPSNGSGGSSSSGGRPSNVGGRPSNGGAKRSRGGKTSSGTGGKPLSGGKRMRI